ncbi:MAG TPA: hypothetical protein VKL40_07130 [Candidatus Angelobacter sp.]|nr:hypothetical protein [Candidatus Angelobacter sp.]
MSQQKGLRGLLLAIATLASLSAPAEDVARSKIEVRRIILHSRHLGAHGIGYNDHSLVELSQELTPADIPILISLLSDSELRVGAQFALASQCEAAIMPVRRAVITDKRVSSLDADDIFDLIADFSRCRPEAQAAARAMRVEIDKLVQERLAQRTKELDKQAGDDTRIQRNAFKMSDPAQKRTLTQAEREEAFRRSIKAAGLEHPQTAAQKALVDRMYRTMVLDEPSPAKTR